MNPVVQAQMDKFRNANPSVHLSETDFFEVFSIHSVANGLKSESMDPFGAHLEGKEFGLDGIAILIQGVLCRNSDDVKDCLAHGKNHEIEFCLFQSKTSEKIEYGELSKFFDASFQFLTGDFLDPTAQLQDLIDAKNAVYDEALKRNPKLHLYYVTTGKGELSNQNSKLVDATTARFDEQSIFSDIQITTPGAKSIQDGYRSATNSNSKDVEINKPITLPDHPSVQQAFLG